MKSTIIEPSGTEQKKQKRKKERVVSNNVTRQLQTHYQLEKGV